MEPEYPPRHCGLYKPGHEVHWIQGLRYRDPEHPLVPGTLVEVGEDGIIAVEFADGVRRFWNHEPQRLRDIVATADNRVGLQERWGLLGIPTKSGYYCFCIAGPESDAHDPCPEQPPTGDMFDLMKSAGGFTISLNDARTQLAKHGRRGNASEHIEHA
jgi:hypothetical protein